MTRRAPPELTFASLKTLAKAWRPDTRYLDNDDVEREIAELLTDTEERVKSVSRGTSPKGLPITEVVVEEKVPGPKQHIVWHLDPHAADEREALIAGFRYARFLLDHPELLHGRSLHLYISSPDDRARIAALYRNFPEEHNLGIALRNRDVRTQAGWTNEPLDKPFTDESSPGWRGLDAVIRDVITRVDNEPGSNFCVFIPGHSATAADGVNWLVGAHTYAKRRFIGKQLERTARVLFSASFSKGSGDAWYLRRIRLTRAVYPADTRRAREREGVPDIGTNDAELALYRDREAFEGRRRRGHHRRPRYPVTVNSEIPQLELEETLKRERMTEDELRVEIKELRRLQTDGLEMMAQAGDLAARLLERTIGLEVAEHLEILEFYGAQRANPSFDKGDMVMDPQGQIVDEVTATVIMLKDLAVARAIFKNVLAKVSMGGSGRSTIVEETMIMTKDMAWLYGAARDRVEDLYEIQEGELDMQVVSLVAYAETAFAASFNARLENDFDPAFEAVLEPSFS